MKKIILSEFEENPKDPKDLNLFKTNAKDGIGHHILKSNVFKVIPSYPFENYGKLRRGYKYQGYITGVYKDRLSGNLNLLIDLGLKQDLIVLKESYDNYINCIRKKNSPKILIL